MATNSKSAEDDVLLTLNLPRPHSCIQDDRMTLLSLLSNHPNISRQSLFGSGIKESLKRKLSSIKVINEYFSSHNCISLGVMKHIFTLNPSLICAEPSGFKGLFRLNNYLFYYNDRGQQYVRSMMTEKEWSNTNGRFNEWRQQIKKHKSISDKMNPLASQSQNLENEDCVRFAARNSPCHVFDYESNMPCSNILHPKL